MKKVLLYITLFAGIFAATSCDKNLPPVFDDANAFVAFDSATASIDEAVVEKDGSIKNQATLRIPVTLASVKGLTETVKFTVADGTAKAGVNYNLKTTSGTISFDAENRTQYIEFEILYFNEYTGDLNFIVTLSENENINLGYLSSCTVTVGDVDHPLSALIGEYTATSGDGNVWSMVLKKDEKDDHMVWFFNIFGNAGWAIDGTMFYGNVDDEMESINIPFGQQSVYKYGGETPVTLYWLDNDDKVGKTGSITVKILKDADGKITGLDFGTEYGFYALLEGLGYVGLVYPQITAVKK
ncbi:MAG: hypothetical protein K6E35_04755 [Bacteroidales bacterium]|nr:hypothetical protein [Bacteroidales bacterium]